MTLLKGTKVKITRDLNDYGYEIKKGDVLEIAAADYESDIIIYLLKGDNITTDDEIWVYSGDFTPIPNLQLVN